MGYYGDPGFAYGCAPMTTMPMRTGGYGAGFALILVLFILLVIIGAAWAY